MKRIVLSLVLVLATASNGHALRSGSGKSLTVQNGAATMGCVTDGGTGAALFFDADGTTAATSAACTSLPTCSAGNYLRWDGSSFSCTPPSSSSSVNLIATQSHTPISGDGSSTGNLFMGLGGAIRNTNIAFQQVMGTPTFKNLRCNTNNVVTSGQNVVITLGYITSYGQGGGLTITTFSPSLSVTLDGTNNVGGAQSTNTTSALPSGAWVGYQMTYTSNFPVTSADTEIYCTVERAS